jgi:polysaccharide biosynthesis PFTS motif protein
MRAYGRLKRNRRLGQLATTRDALTNTRFDTCERRASAIVYGAAIAHAELATRQYLLRRVVTAVWLYESLLIAIGQPSGAVVHPLPREWRRELQRQGFHVAPIRSALAWSGYVLALFGYGLLAIAQETARAMRQIVTTPAPGMAHAAFFVGIGRGNLPQPGRYGRSHDVISWYRQWPGRVQPLAALCHSVAGVFPGVADGTPVRTVDGPVPPLASSGALLRFAWWSICAVAITSIDLARGRWWHAVMLREAVIATVARLQPPGRLAAEYLLHNTDALYRPLWTYEAEQRGSRVTFYFYSTNNESFKEPDGYPIQSGSWQVMNWPRYLVWNEPQAEFVRRAVGTDAAIDVVGPIWFSASPEPVPDLPDGCIAVFDVQPHRPSRYRLLGLQHEFYTPDTATAFLLHIHQIMMETGRTMALKRKRSIGSLLHRRYRATLTQLSASPHLIAVPPEVSAQLVIERVAAVISMPFTSTALLAETAGKPSIYYDPHGFIQPDDRAAHGIPVVAGIDGLRAWVTSLQPADAGAAVVSMAVSRGAR